MEVKAINKATSDTEQIHRLKEQWEEQMTYEGGEDDEEL